MASKKQLYGLAIILVGTAIDWILIQVGRHQICTPSENGARTICDKVFLGFVEPVLSVLIGFLIVYIITLFIKKPALSTWKIFSIVSLPIIVLVLYFFEDHSFIGPDREQVAWLLSISFVVISLLLIAYKSWRLKSSQ